MSEQPLHNHKFHPDIEDPDCFWQGLSDRCEEAFLVEPVRKKSLRRRGEHCTKAKCARPEWFRPARYKALGGQLGHAYHRLVMKDPQTGQPRLRMHMSRHPLYVRERERAGRKYAFRPEKQCLLDALWPAVVSFCDAGKHSVGMCVSRLAYELSPKDEKGQLIAGQEVTVSRLSRLIDEQIRFGVLAISEEKTWDRESRTWFPKYVWITALGFTMLGVDLVKLEAQQQKKLRESEERRRLIAEGVMSEHDELSPHAARQRWAAQKRAEALKFRRQRGADRKRANRLARLPRDSQVYEMSQFVLKTMAPDEAYWCTPQRLEQLAIQRLYQLELALATPPPH